MIKIGRPVFIVALIAMLIAGVVAFKFFVRSSPHNASIAEKAVYYCPMHPNYTSDRPGNCPICNMTLVKRETAQPTTQATAISTHQDHQGMAVTPKVFTVDKLVKMKPQEICLLHKCKMGQCLIAMTPEFARLGKCPHCGEDLGVIVKEALTPSGYTNINLSPEKVQAVGVKTEPVKVKALSKTIRTTGRIAYDPELYQAQQEYLQSITTLNKAETADPEIKAQAAQLVESAKIKLRLLGLNQDLMKEIETAGKPDRSLLYSDSGGTVWLYANIFEYELPLVKVGDKITAEVPGVSGQKFEGTIRAIDSVLDPTTRSARVRAILQNPEGVLKPEMYVNASIEKNLGENLAVPEEAVFRTGEKNIVFVMKADGTIEPREVTLGASVDNFYQVNSGLAAGEMVVTSGNFLIDSESRLKAALEGMGSGGGHQHGG